jgi:hypothetical protein
MMAELGLVILCGNPLACYALSVQQFLSVKDMAVVSQLHYSPGLAPCDFFVSKNEIGSYEAIIYTLFNKNQVA